jgi:hypothetical protein
VNDDDAEAISNQSSIVSCRSHRSGKEFAMNPTAQKPSANGAAPGFADETLRLLASLPAPEGLEERVTARLHAAANPTSRFAANNAKILAWPTKSRLDLVFNSNWLRSAAAAAIACVVIGSSWSVYSRVQVIQPTAAIAPPRVVATPGGFSSAGAKRLPQTLNGPLVLHVPQQPAPPVRKQTRKSAPKPLDQGFTKIAPE